MALDTIEWAAVAAWAAVLATIGGALYTRSLARSAKESLRLARAAESTALDQAHSARDSAESARVSKEAAVDQARSARRSLELQRVERNRADAPRFDLHIDPAEGEYVCSVRVTMLDGPPVVDVAISYINGWAQRDDSGEIERRETSGRTARPKRLIKNSATTFSGGAPASAVAIWSKVKIESAEVGGEGRTWTDVQQANWTSPTDNVW